MAKPYIYTCLRQKCGQSRDNVDIIGFTGIFGPRFFRAFWGGLQRGLAVALPERLQINLLNDSSFPAERFGELAHEKDSRGFPRESP